MTSVAPILVIDVPGTVAYKAKVTFVELANDAPDNTILIVSPFVKYPCGNTFVVGDNVFII